jgi:hypothetical protein
LGGEHSRSKGETIYHTSEIGEEILSPARQRS